MSASDWTLLTGDRGINFPRNYEIAGANPLFWPAVEFTIRYTVIVTVLLIGLGLRPRAPGAGERPLGRASSARCSSSRSRSASRRRRCSSGASIRADRARSTRILQARRADRRADPVLRHATRTRCSRRCSSSSGSSSASTCSSCSSACRRSRGSVYEAASIDGAGRWQTFRRITLPLLRPSLALALILCVTGSLLAFDQFYILTKGGPDNSTVTIVQLIYREAFLRQNLGTAAALSVVAAGRAAGPQPHAGSGLLRRRGRQWHER